MPAQATTVINGFPTVQSFHCNDANPEGIPVEHPGNVRPSGHFLLRHQIDGGLETIEVSCEPAAPEDIPDYGASCGVEGTVGQDGRRVTRVVRLEMLKKPDANADYYYALSVKPVCGPCYIYTVIKVTGGDEDTEMLVSVTQKDMQLAMLHFAGLDAIVAAMKEKFLESQ